MLRSRCTLAEVTIQLITEMFKAPITLCGSCLPNMSISLKLLHVFACGTRLWGDGAELTRFFHVAGYLICNHFTRLPIIKTSVLFHSCTHFVKPLSTVVNRETINNNLFARTQRKTELNLSPTEQFGQLKVSFHY